MIITKITRSYSKSFNAKNYGLHDEWIKTEAIFEGTPDNGDDPIQVSEVLYDAAKKQVMDNVAVIIERMKEGAQAKRNMASGIQASPSPVAQNIVNTPAPVSTAPQAQLFKPVGERTPLKPIGPETSPENDMAVINKAVNEITENGRNPGALFPSTEQANPQGSASANGLRPL